MPVPASSLSVAVQGIADFLVSQFGQDVVISVAHPQKAFEQAKGASGNAAHCLNLFAYRIAPSGFHADVGSDQTHFIRLNALITPFPADLDNAEDDADLRILGHAIRVLQSNPILPIGANPLPDGAIPPQAGLKSYRLQAILQAPAMEELNHIWTTQGGELAYRLSAAYEFALVPIEPMDPRVDAAPPRTLMLDGGIGVEAGRQDFNSPSTDSRAFALGDGQSPIPVTWAPVTMFVDGTTLTNTLTVAAGTTQTPIALAGPPPETAAIDIVWTMGDATEQLQTIQILSISSAVLDSPDARSILALSIPNGAVSGVVRTRPAMNAAPIPGSSFGNTLSLTVN
jgi:hypothetical protein